MKQLLLILSFLILPLLFLLFSSSMVVGQENLRQYTDTVKLCHILDHLIRMEKGLQSITYEGQQLGSGISKMYVWSKEGDSEWIVEQAELHGALDEEGFIDVSHQKLSFWNCSIHAKAIFKKLKINELDFIGCESRQSRVYNLDGSFRGWMPASILIDSCSFGELNFFESIISDGYDREYGDCFIRNSTSEEATWMNIAAKNLIVENSKFRKLVFDRLRVWDNIILRDNVIGSNDTTSTQEMPIFDEKDSSSWKSFFFLESISDINPSLHAQNNTFKLYSKVDSSYAWKGGERVVDRFYPVRYHHGEIQGSFNTLNFTGNSVNSTFEFFDANIEHELIINGNVFQNALSISGLFFSEKRNTIGWGQFSGFRLASIRREIEEVESAFGTSYNIYFNRGLSNEDIADSLGYYALLSSYKALYDIYKKNNEMVFANSCYAEMKKVETRYWKYLFNKEGKFENYFRWRLNDFLSYFTDYGTNPAKAVIKSIWVILIFAIFYLFFPSDWDVSNRSEMLGRWKDLFATKREKSLLSTFLFLLYTGFIHLLNAVTLSLNAFTTLGFGDIPTHGAARYVTIVQGFIGWFLLTIFSVSLINQVLG